MEYRQRHGCTKGTAGTLEYPPPGRSIDHTGNEPVRSVSEPGELVLKCDHLCCLYEHVEERQILLRALVVQGLRRHEKVIHVTDELAAKSSETHLEQIGVDLQSYLASGQLRVLTALQTYVRNGCFDPDRVRAWLGGEARRAEVEGYAGLRIAAEMSWVLHGIEGSDRLIEFEGELDRFLRGRKCRLVCLYDGRRFAPAVLQHVFTAHRTVVLGTAVCFNPYYRVAPASFGEGPASATLGRWLADLRMDNQAMPA